MVLETGADTKRGRGTVDGGGRKREDLEASAIEGDEVLGEQTVACLDVVVEDHLEDGADAVAPIEAHALTVGGQDEKQVQPLLVGGEGGEEAVAQQAVG